MPVKSGSDFNDHYNGSTGSDGETRESNWHGWSDGDTVSINHAKDGHGSMLAKGGETSNTTKSSDHIHYYDNPDSSSPHHK